VASAFERRAAPIAPATILQGSFADAELPAGCDAVVAVGEVLGYESPARPHALGAVLARPAGALRRGGLLLCDLAGPGRVPAGGQRSWAEGDGWAVLVDAAVEGTALRRRIVTSAPPAPPASAASRSWTRCGCRRPRTCSGAGAQPGSAPARCRAATPAYRCRAG
jgi:hypothetical protein